MTTIGIQGHGEVRPIGWIRAAQKAYRTFPEPVRDQNPAASIESGVDAVSTDSEFGIVKGRGEVFRDLGDPQADLKQAKAVLAARIVSVLDHQGLTVREASQTTGFAAADFSRIRNADLGRFTLDRLIRMLGAIDTGVRVTVQIVRCEPHPQSIGPVGRALESAR